MSKKPLIVFEGVEGSGKSYHIKSVSNYLKKKKIGHILIREPGGTKNAEKIRNLILNRKSNFNQNTDLFLYLASRSENIDIIQKNYRKKIILIDRFIDSTTAYQHYGFGIDLKLINLLNDYLLNNIKIDLTFLNIVNSKNMLLRIKKRKNLNRYDTFKFNFYRKVQRGFLKLSKNKRKKYIIINSNLDQNYNKSIITKNLDKII